MNKPTFDKSGKLHIVSPFTFRDLYVFCTTQNNFKHQFPGMFFLFERKVNEFVQKNIGLINTMNQELNRLVKEHYELDEQGQIKIEKSEMLNEKGEKMAPRQVLLDGKTEAMYLEAHQELMNKSCNIER